MGGEFPFARVKAIGVPGFFGPSGFAPNVQSFTTPGAFLWTKPTTFPAGSKGIKNITVIVIGGGGGGGGDGGSFTNSAGGAVDGGDGGSGGGAGVATYLPAALPATVAGTIGTGGAGAPSPGTQIALGSLSAALGSNGTASNFGAFITANGGIGGNAGGWPNGGTATVSGTGSPTGVLQQQGGKAGDGNWNATHPNIDGAIPSIAGAGGGSGGAQVNGGTLRVAGNGRSNGALGVVNAATKPATPTGGGGGGGAVLVTPFTYTGGLNGGDGAPGGNSGDGGGGGGTASGNPGGGGSTGGAGGNGQNGAVIVITNFF